MLSKKSRFLLCLAMLLPATYLLRVVEIEAAHAANSDLYSQQTVNGFGLVSIYTCSAPTPLDLLFYGLGAAGVVLFLSSLVTDFRRWRRDAQVSENK